MQFIREWYDMIMCTCMSFSTLENKTWLPSLHFTHTRCASITCKNMTSKLSIAMEIYKFTSYWSLCGIKPTVFLHICTLYVILKPNPKTRESVGSHVCDPPSTYYYFCLYIQTWGGKTCWCSHMHHLYNKRLYPLVSNHVCTPTICALVPIGWGVKASGNADCK